MRTLKKSWLFFAYIFSIIFVMRVVHVSCQCLETERYYLLQLKGSLYGGQKLVTWNNQSLDCCSWSGIGCNADGRVVSLDLSYSRLSGQIPIDISRLKNLSDIRLANNDLNGIFPQEIFHLQSLRAIDLSSNENLQGSLPEFSKNNSLEELVLSFTNFSGGLPYAIGNLKSLTILEISYCRFSGTIPKSLSNLTKLTDLGLRSNMFVGSIPSLTFLSHLIYLDLSNNHFLTGSIQSTNWEGLTKLGSLNLVSTSLSGSIPMSVFRAPSMTSLFLRKNQFNDISNEHLNMSSSSSQLVDIDLSSNNISGSFPHFVLQLTKLLYLRLSGNKLSGSLPDFSSMQKLERLFLSSNNFNGSFPKLGFDMKNLHFLDLSSNNLSGPFPNSIFMCENLSNLYLSYNSFSGIFYTSMIKQFKNLGKIDLSYSGFSVVEDDIDVPSSLPPLSGVYLAACGLKRFPEFLRNISNLNFLDLSKNQISGEIPNWIWEQGASSYFYLNLSYNFLEDIDRRVVNVPSIQILDLHSNRLRGELPFFPKDAVYLDYSMNNFSSGIPHSIPNSSLSSVEFLSLSDNHLNGIIPESICKASSINVLNLSNNSLSGPIPQCISALTNSLRVLNLGMNNLNGTVSDALFQPDCQLGTLDLNGNRLSGKVPESLVNCKGLQVLNLGNNQIDDTFPCLLKEISNLSVLVLRSNKFHGDLRCRETKAHWPKLQIVDLSSNSFNGKLSGEWFLSWKAMMVVNESKSALIFEFHFISTEFYQDVVTLNLKGTEMKLEKILTMFTSIDLSSNNFEGAIPLELGNLGALYCLNLSRNNFMGQIPSSLGSLKQLESLDLSRNKLIGSIPQQLADLTFLQVLNLSFNQLEGPIPRGRQLDNLCEDSFLGNMGLIGPQVNRTCKYHGETVASPPTSFHDNKKRPKKSELRWELIGAEVGFICGLGIVVWSLVFWRRWREWYFDCVDRVLWRIQCHLNQRRPNQLRRRGGK